jgi:CRP/FNR family transcriptional regulator, cyclic AMP receptor protein
VFAARDVHLLDLAPELADEMTPERAALARRHLLVRMERIAAGTWSPEADVFGARGGLGLLITDGFAVRRVSLGRRAASELLAAGDVLRPWEDDGEHAAYPFSASLRVVEPLVIGVLDARVTQRLVHFPEIVSSLMGAVMRRSRRVVGHLVIAQMTSVELRIHVALWHLADRFGRVRPDGIAVPIRLTQEMLGHIVGARRPSVTVGLGRLVEQGLVEPLPGGGWLLKGDPPEASEVGTLFRTGRRGQAQPSEPPSRPAPLGH